MDNQITGILKSFNFEEAEVEGAYRLKVDDDEIIRVYVMDISTNPFGECFLEHYGEIYRFDGLDLADYLHKCLQPLS